MSKTNTHGQPDPNIFLWIAGSVSDAAAVNCNGMETLLINGLNTFFIRDKPVFSNGNNSLSRSLTGCANLCNCVLIILY